MESYPLPRNRVPWQSADDGFIWWLMTVLVLKRFNGGKVCGVCLVDMSLVDNLWLIQ